ncbi:hypothetical protein JYU34_003359 [Plutella xylostella]|uniref:Major facilitator superfamily associated domain-containing protein n=1 Tax=Plutella xylostella TaxID=51655 RepID=A0ABQ7QZU6_PLUXY|nr:hypothetical protein JYU34_003359 [Plutella xylostella]
MQFVRSFFKRITDDLKQKKLIPLKVLFFVHASTLFVLYPYLTIHMRELGINVEETAIMSAVTPVVSIVMPPLAGMLADKIGNFRLLLALSSVLGGASALLLLAVPVGRLTVTFPPAAELLATCGGGGGGGGLRLRHMTDYPCTPRHPYAYDLNLTILTCGFICELPDNLTPDEAAAIARSQSYDVRIQAEEARQRLVYRHSVAHPAPRPARPARDQSTSRIMTNDPYVNISISRLSDRELFFPAPRLYQMECSGSAGNVTCSFGSDDILDTDDVKADAKFRVRISHEPAEVTDVREYAVQAISPLNSTKFEDYNGSDSVMCQNYFDAGLSGGATVRAGGRHLRCSPACAAAAPRAALCDNPQQQLELDPSFTFWAYLAIGGRMARLPANRR